MRKKSTWQTFNATDTMFKKKQYVISIQPIRGNLRLWHECQMTYLPLNRHVGSVSFSLYVISDSKVVCHGCWKLTGLCKMRDRHWSLSWRDPKVVMYYSWHFLTYSSLSVGLCLFDWHNWRKKCLKKCLNMLQKEMQIGFLESITRMIRLGPSWDLIKVPANERS